MAVVKGSFTNLASGTGTRNWTSPTTASKAYGVVVIVGGATEETSGVTWGGVAMTRAVTAAHAAGETGTTSVWFLDAPGTGGQTVEITRSGSTAYIATAFDGTSATGHATYTDTNNVGWDEYTATTSSASLTTLTIPSGRVVAMYGGCYSGENAPGSVTANGDLTNRHSQDFGNFNGFISDRTSLYTGTGGAYTNFNYTQSSDDMAVAVLAVHEAAATVSSTFTANAVIKRTTSVAALGYVSQIGTSGSGNDQFLSLRHIATDGTYLYVADANNNRIQKRLASDLSFVSQIGTSGSGNDQFAFPNGIATDGTHVWVTDYGNDRIVKRLASNLSYVSQIGTSGTGNDQFSGPSAIATDGTHVWVTDSNNNRIVKRLAADALTYVSKLGTAGSGNDQFSSPSGVVLLGTHVYVSDALNNRIVKRLAADALTYVSKLGTAGSGNDQFSVPLGIATDGTFLYIGDNDNNRLVKRLATDAMTFVDKVGSLGSGHDQFSDPWGVAVTGGYVYVADVLNNRIVKRLVLSPFTMDAVLALAGTTQTGSFSANAVRKRTQTGSFTADTVLKREQTGSLTADAVIKREQSGSFTANAVIKPAPNPVMSYFDTVMADRPVWYGRLGERSGTTMVDEVGSLDGTYVNTPTLGVAGSLSGDTDTGVRFTQASDEHASIPDNAVLDFGDTFSIEVWVKRASTGAWQYIVDKDVGGPTLYFDSTDHVELGLSGTGTCFEAAVLTDTASWHHIVATKDGATATVIYIDGEVSPGTYTPRTMTNTSTPMWVAWDGSTAGEELDGSMDELAFYNYPLTAQQVADHYASADISRNPYATVVLADGPVGFWRLNESSGTTAVDAVAARNGTYVNTPTHGMVGPLSGDYATGVGFATASSEYVTVPDNAVFDFGTGDFSLEIWYKCAVASSGTQKWLLSKNSQFNMLIETDGSLVVDNFTTHAFYDTAPIDTDTDWHHLVFTRTGSTYLAYLDGASLAGTSQAQTFSANADDLWIGAESEDVAIPFNGSLANAAVYNYVLTPTQVLNHYTTRVNPTQGYSQLVYRDTPVAYYRMSDSGTDMLDEIAGNHGTYVNTPTLNEFGAMDPVDTDTSVLFTQANDEYATIPDATQLDFGDVFTFECWLKRNSAGSYQYVFAGGTNAPVIAFDSGDAIVLNKGSVGDSVISLSTSATSDTTSWHYLVITKNGAAQFIYFDGLDITDLVTDKTMASNAETKHLGWDGGSAGEEWDGWLDEVAIYNYALSLAQIKAHYASRILAPGSYRQKVVDHNASAYWRLGEPSGTNANNEMGPLDGTYVGSPTLGTAGGITGDADTAVVLNGSSQYITVPDDFTLDVGDGPWTWELWANIDTLAGFLLNKTTHLFIGINGSGQLNLENYSTADYIAKTSLVLGTGVWYHLVVTRSGSGAGNSRLYVDGIDYTVDGPSVADAMSNNTQDLFIGANPTPDSFFDGSLDEVALYSAVLTPDQVRTHWIARTVIVAVPAVALGATGSFTANAVIRKTGQAGSFTANAVIRKTGQAGSFAAAAVIKRTQAGTFTADAALKKTQSASFTADAVIRRLGLAGSFTANAILRKTMSADEEKAASLTVTPVPIGFGTTSAFTRTAQSFTPGLSGSLWRVTYMLAKSGSPADTAEVELWSHSGTHPGSLIGPIASHAPGDVTTSLVRYTTSTLNFPLVGSVKYWIVFRRSGANDTGNAYAIGLYPSDVGVGGNSLWNLSSWSAEDPLDIDFVADIAFGFTTDAAVKRTQTGSFTADAVIRKTGQTGTFTTDAVIRRERTGSLTANALVIGAPVWVDTFTRTINPGLGSPDIGGGYSKTALAAVDGDSAYPLAGSGYFIDGGRGLWDAVGQVDVFVDNDGSVTDEFRISLRRAQIFIGSGEGWQAGFVGAGASTSFSPDIGDWWTVKFAISGTGGDNIATAIKAWRRDGAEPVGWDSTGTSTYTNSQQGLQTAGLLWNPVTGGLLIDNIYVLPAGRIAWTMGALTADAVVRRSYEASFTADAYIVSATADFSLTADAVIRRPTTASLTADAVVFRTQTGSLTADAAIKRTASAVFTADAVVKTTIASSFTASAVVKRTATAAFVSDAVLKKTQSGSYSEDAVLKKTATSSFTADAYLLAVRVGSFTADAVTKKTQAGSLTGDAVIWRTQAGSFTEDAVVKTTASGSFTANAVIRKAGTGSFTADAVIIRTQTGSFLADAAITKSATGSFTADAVTKKTAAGSFTGDAVLRRTVGASIVADAVLFKTQTASFSADAVVTRGATGSFTADAWVLRIQTGTWVADAVVLRTQVASFTADAVIMPTFTMDAVLRRTTSGSVSADAVIMPVFAADAVLKREQTASFTADAYILTANSGGLVLEAVIRRTDQAGSFVEDAVVRRTTSGSHAADAVISRSASTGLTTDAIVRRTQTGSFTADAVITQSQTGSFTADAVEKKTQTGSFTANASISGASGAYFTQDAVLKASISGTFSSDAVLKTAVTGSFTANAVLLTANSRTFTADAVLATARTSGLVADAVLLSPRIASLTADASITAGGIASFTADAVVLASRSGALTADAVVQVGRTGSLTADAYLVLIGTGSLTADAVLFRTQVGSFTADAVVTTSSQFTVSLDAVRLETRLQSLIGDAVLFKVEQGQLSANAQVLQVVQGSFDAASVVRRIASASVTADAVINSATSFTLDATIRGLNEYPLTLDAVITRFHPEMVASLSITELASALSVSELASALSVVEMGSDLSTQEMSSMLTVAEIDSDVKVE